MLLFILPKYLVERHLNLTLCLQKYQLISMPNFLFFKKKLLAKFVFVVFKEIVIIKQLFLSYFLVFTHNFRLESKQKSMFILSFLLMKNFIVYLILNQFMYYSCLLDLKSNLNTINQIKSDRYFFFL